MNLGKYISKLFPLDGLARLSFQRVAIFLNVSFSLFFNLNFVYILDNLMSSIPLILTGLSGG